MEELVEKIDLLKEILVKIIDGWNVDVVKKKDV